ncbi:methyl-accepting chemotaxis protein [Tumebacillus sp. ITR2]|uniref:Methyl-accepting chemotaxis protein n=1 Tax=Tumebacillus amylolyticus TaxID=2801339 RepID=A0ABS1J795_9BACL|nr:methyl-accepting chemotaxis protein [Tumebacillus amylolyticus]MBL0385924.1 methyl-accepting chemotaxis protein [Tumebacillus amylolyticus]
MFRRMPLVTKLLCLLLIPLVALGVTSQIALRNLNSISDDLTQVLYQHDYVTLDLIAQAQGEMHDALLLEHTLLNTDPSSPTFGQLKTSMEEHAVNARAKVHSARKLAEEDKSNWETFKHPQTQRTIFQNFDDFDSNFSTWVQVSAGMIEKLPTQSISARQETIGKINEVDYTFQAALGSMGETKELLDSVASHAVERKDASKKTAAQSIVLTIVIAIVLAISFMALFMWNIRKSLRRTLGVMEQAAQGDLRETSQPKLANDEIGKLSNALHEMVKNLRGLIEQVTVTAEQVAATSEVMTKNAEEMKASTTGVAGELEQLALGVDVQAAGADQISKSMEEMGDGIHRIAENTGVVTQAAVETASEADAGQESIQRAVTQMHSISTVTDRSADKVRRLGQHSSAIGQIVGVITKLAQQTNMLALNASIEAARAGEQGRGFAVVAEEVRKLAEQSQQSAHQIEELIERMQEDTQDTVQTMDDVIHEVQSGIVAVDVAGEAFQRILTKSHLVAGQIREITAAAEQMTATTQQVASSAQESAGIAHLTARRSQTCAVAVEQQLASMDELYHLSEGLNQMAHELKKVLGRFEM